MNTEKFLQFFIKHNALLIEAMIALILVTAGYLAYRSFKSSRDEETGALPPDMSNLEETLKKILEKANQIPVQTQAGAQAASAGAAPATVAATAEAATLSVEINKLKQELQQKQTEIESIKTSTAGASAAEGGLSSDEKNVLTGQINELKRKLEEYDIISADIADLSFYKEENARLQKELSAKGASSTAAPPPQPAAPTAPPPPPVQAAPVQAEPPPQAAPTPAPAATSAAIPPTTSAEHAVENVIDDDIMKDFAAAVADQGGTALTELEIPPIDPITAESVEGTAPTPAAAADSMPNIDIPALGDEKSKTAAPAETKPAEEVDASHLGSLDIDKMVSEVGALPDASHVEQIDSLSGTMDPEKIAMEASSFTPPVTPKVEEKDLMGQFENFVKKDNS